MVQENTKYLCPDTERACHCVDKIVPVQECEPDQVFFNPRADILLSEWMNHSSRAPLELEYVTPPLGTIMPLCPVSNNEMGEVTSSSGPCACSVILSYFSWAVDSKHYLQPPPLRHPRTLLEAISILFVSPEAIFHFLKTLQPPYFLFFQNTSSIATKVISPSQHSNSLLELFRRSDCCPCFRGTPPTSALLSDHITSYFRHHFPTLATSPVRTNFSSHLDPPFLLFHYDITYDAQSLLGWNFLRVKSVSYIYIL